MLVSHSAVIQDISELIDADGSIERHELERVGSHLRESSNSNRAISPEYRNCLNLA